MPELTARTIIEHQLKPKYDLPAIFFSFDEQSGQEGFRTRLEAFCDLMHSRRTQSLISTGKKTKPEKKKDYTKVDNYGNNFLQEIKSEIIRNNQK